MPLAALLLLATLRQAPKPLLDATPKPTSEDVKATRSTSGIAVAISPGKDGYPGIAFPGAMDLSKYGHVEAQVVNTGPKPLNVALRVDNAGNWQDNPWNTESIFLQPGETGTVKTIFGYQYGQKKGFKLDPSKVVNLLVFTTKADGPQSFRIVSIKADGPAGEKPPVAQDDFRSKPMNGVVYDGASPDPAVVFSTEGGASLTTGAIFAFPATGIGTGHVSPKVGRWDLRDASQISVAIRNVGQEPTYPTVFAQTNGGETARVSFGRERPLLPGAWRQYFIPFGSLTNLPDLPQSGTNDAVRSIAVQAPGGGQLQIVFVKTLSPVSNPPTWLGKRPPVPGDWTKTLDDEFTGAKLDPTVWKVTGENYYDKQTHWSKDNVIVKDGFVRLRYEKKAGFQNDDPKRNSTPYAVGYLDTFGLWAQRYGYFEARMKLPKSPGLWPAFWMMPDRGSKGGVEQWKRQDIANGGMEFDIMEHLTRWGPHRYNIAMHYDGYQKDHKSLGSDKIYAEPDKDGFITCGLLWTPGEAVYYCNGLEVLRWKNPRVSTVPSILMFTLPMGGWDNDALDDEKLPADFVIDYVRVWQRRDLASSADGKRLDP